jgi:hypothetical protein
VYDENEMLRQTEETLREMAQQQFELNAFKYALVKAKKSSVSQVYVIAHLEKIIEDREKTMKGEINVKEIY